MGDNFHLGILSRDFADERRFLRSGKSWCLEIQSNNVEELTQKILDLGVRKLDALDPLLSFQAPGGQCFRLVGINEDLSQYEGTGEGPSVGKGRNERSTRLDVGSTFSAAQGSTLTHGGTVTAVAMPVIAEDRAT
jgi:hypothetical protein